jgi:hypothetical protein
MITQVSQPELRRQVRQQRADIDSLYELVERVEQKVDALDVKLDRRFDQIRGQLSEVLRQLSQMTGAGTYESAHHAWARAGPRFSGRPNGGGRTTISFRPCPMQRRRAPSSPMADPFKRIAVARA